MEIQELIGLLVVAVVLVTVELLKDQEEALLPQVLLLILSVVLVLVQQVIQEVEHGMLYHSQDLVEVEHQDLIQDKLLMVGMVDLELL